MAIFYLFAFSGIMYLSFYVVKLGMKIHHFSELCSSDFSSSFLVWEELAYYEENTREFLFPEPKLTPSNPGIGREVLMKTAAGFPVSDLCPAGSYW